MKKVLFLFLILIFIISCTSTPSTSETSEPIETSEQNTVEIQDSEDSIHIYDELTADEKSFISLYLDKITYMVYSGDHSEEEAIYNQSSVITANEFFIKNKMDTIDINQIEELKKEQELTYEEETGQSMSILQWIAGKLNADIYIEIMVKTDGMTKGEKYYGNAQVNLKAYETSTSILMGAVSHGSIDLSYSSISEEEARLDAIQLLLSRCMPDLILQVKENMEKAMYQGIRYEVIIQNPANDKVMGRFSEKLAANVKDIKNLSVSEKEIKYHIWHIGSLEDLKNVIYTITRSIIELENIVTVLSRGKSVTFNTGL